MEWYSRCMWHSDCSSRFSLRRWNISLRIWFCFSTMVVTSCSRFSMVTSYSRSFFFSSQFSARQSARSEAEIFKLLLPASESLSPLRGKIKNSSKAKHVIQTQVWGLRGQDHSRQKYEFPMRDPPGYHHRSGYFHRQHSIHKYRTFPVEL